MGILNRGVWKTPLAHRDPWNTIDVKRRLIMIDESRGGYVSKKGRYTEEESHQETLRNQGINCSWSILSTRQATFGLRRPLDFAIKIHLKKLEIEGCNDCDCGSLEVFERKTESYKPPKLIYRVCGSSLPKEIVSEAENVFVRFHTNINPAGKTILQFGYSLKDLPCKS